MTPPTTSPRDTLLPMARVITRLNIGGPSIQAARLTTALESHGYRTRLLHGRLGDGEGDMAYLLAPDADAIFVSTLCRPVSPVDDLRALVRLFQEFRRLKPVLVHTHMAKAGLLGRVAAMAYNLTRGTAPRARVVHTYHGHVLEGYFRPSVTAVFLGLERLLARVTDAIVAISPAIREELLETYCIGTPAQYHVVPLGFDLAPFGAVDDEARVEARRALGLPPDAPVVTTVGRLTAIKQHDLFLEVVARVAERHPALVALVAGDGELRADLEARARALGLADRLRFLGWRRDLPVLYAATDVFVLTSRNEGTPVALIEAMASGVPGVSTDVGGVRDVIDSPETGVAVTGLDALAEGVTALLDDPARRAAMGRDARASVMARYGFDRLVDDVARLYASLLRDPRP
ncbi:MAG: glycosyltransferase [Vicinamibacterales bacterium]|nr:glycosyltransferase [Vicinamibacterales bacterium]